MLGFLARLERSTGALIGWIEGPAWRRAVAFFAIALVTLLPGLAALPPTDRDESRFVQASRQMVETGDLVDIRFQDEPRWQKPVGIYWLQAAAASLAGGADAPIWAWRLPSALAVALAGLLAFWALLPLAGRRAAAIAGLMLVTAVLPVAEGHIAKTDAVLLALVLVQQGALARLVARDAPGRFGRFHALFWAALGLGILVKGPIAPLVAALTLGWLAAAGQGRGLLPRIGVLPGLALALLIALPWFVLIHLRTGGAFFEEAVLGDLLGKVAAGAERHWGPPGYYFMTIWATFWPWAALLLFAAPAVWRQRREPATAFLLGWLVPFWLAFELFATKLPHYMLPVFPALAGLLAMWMTATEKDSPGPTRQLIASGLFAVVGLVLALGVIVGLPILEREASLAGTVLAVLAIVAVAAGARALTDRRITAFLGAGLAASLFAYPAAVGLALPRLDSAFLSPRLAAARATLDACSTRPLAAVGYHEPSLVLAGGTATRLLDAAEAARLLRDEDGWAIFFEERRGLTLADFHAASGLRIRVLGALLGINYNRGRRTTIFLLSREGDPVLAPCLPPRAGERR
jgi:4-amino-4-deoxy-L-arabinose transferase-like glycosyltransferase